jgi:hypothetical protein
MVLLTQLPFLSTITFESAVTELPGGPNWGKVLTIVKVLPQAPYLLEQEPQYTSATLATWHCILSMQTLSQTKQGQNN